MKVFDEGNWSNRMSTWPPMTSCIAGPEPLYGMWMIFVPEEAWNDSPSMWLMLPPAANGTTRRIGRVGYDCAHAPAATTHDAMTATRLFQILMRVPGCEHPLCRRNRRTRCRILGARSAKALYSDVRQPHHALDAVGRSPRLHRGAARAGRPSGAGRRGPCALRLARRGGAHASRGAPPRGRHRGAGRGPCLVPRRTPLRAPAAGNDLPGVVFPGYLRAKDRR